MSQALQPDHILQSVNRSVSNQEGSHIGSIMEVTRDSTDTYIEYVILKSDVCFGRGQRYFAVPASSNFIEIAETGKVIMRLNKDDLQFAEGVSADDCPRPNLKHDQSIYELYGYKAPQ